MFLDIKQEMKQELEEMLPKKRRKDSAELAKVAKEEAEALAALRNK